MDGVSSLVEMVSDRLVSVVFYVSQVFLEADVEGFLEAGDPVWLATVKPFSLETCRGHIAPRIG